MTPHEELALAEHVKVELIRLLELVEQAEKNGGRPGMMPSEPVLRHARLADERLDALIRALSGGRPDGAEAG
ncbi:hypothetical protein P12x_003037 [Tundrisphaera lichenicola]|uniref:hypothetical protein n=1 Tax=Tundrisphaera lichenicola TaxID=2029860 RepID=UPI003EC02B7C